jgi:hypothetical protein
VRDPLRVLLRGSSPELPRIPPAFDWALMVLVDGSVWIRFVANREPYAIGLDALLERDEVAGHELVFDYVNWPSRPAMPPPGTDSTAHSLTFPSRTVMAMRSSGFCHLRWVGGTVGPLGMERVPV